MLAQFADVLASADAVAIADVWAGRDPDTTIASAADLAAAIEARRPGLPVLAPGSVEATADRLAEEVRAGDVVLVMGGGASYRIGERLLSRLEVTQMIDYAAAGRVARGLRPGVGRRSMATPGSPLHRGRRVP